MLYSPEVYFRLPAGRREADIGRVSMTEWHVYLQFAHELSIDRIETLLLDELAPYHAVASATDTPPAA